MRRIIEFQTSSNDMSALLTRGRPNAYEDLILVDNYRKYRHQFEAGKTKIRLLPALIGGSDWMLRIPTLQHPNGRHAHPRTIQPRGQSVFDLAYEHMKKMHASRLFSRSNKSGIRLLPSPTSLGWAIVEDANGTKLRLLHHSFYDGCRGGSNGLGNLIYDQVLRAGQDCNELGHPLNPSDGVSLCVERIGGSDTKFPSYRVSLSTDRSPLQPLLEKITEMEHNAICPLEETVRILAPEEEWRLLAKVVGDDLVAEIRSSEKLANSVEGSAVGPRIEDCPTPEESPEVEETEVVADDYKDFPAKWML